MTVECWHLFGTGMIVGASVMAILVWVVLIVREHLWVCADVG